LFQEVRSGFEGCTLTGCYDRYVQKAVSNKWLLPDGLTVDASTGEWRWKNSNALNA
jgi:hypothetical protein